MLCTLYSSQTGFGKLLDSIRNMYPKCNLAVSSDNGSQVATIQIQKGFFKQGEKIRIQYRQSNKPSRQLTDSDVSPFATNIKGLFGYVSSLPTIKENVKGQFLRKIKTLNSEFTIVPERSGGTKELKTLIQALAKDFDAILFVQPNTVISRSMGQHFLDKNLNLIIDGEGNCEIDDLDVETNPIYFDEEQQEVTAEQKQRKEKNDYFLKKHNIRINESLPCIESENATTIRTAGAIAERLTVLSVTNLVAFNIIADAEAVDYLKKNNLWDKVTPNEKLFLDTPSNEKKAVETWKSEAIWVLMWSLKKVDELGFPDKLCNLNNIPYNDYPVGRDKDPNEFIRRITETRSKSEILDAADYYYRLHWACVDARINYKAMETVNPGIVYERHYALNWLINYMEQEWDDITCDT